jgi:hypothetical protein
MDIYTSLVDVFERVLSKYPELPNSQTKELLKQQLERKKFDIQDEAIIEAILKDNDSPLEKSFNQSLNNHLNGLDPEINLGGLLRSEEGQNGVVEIFLSVLENLINYFYNTLIAKHFAGS